MSILVQFRTASGVVVDRHPTGVDFDTYDGVVHIYDTLRGGGDIYSRPIAAYLNCVERVWIEPQAAEEVLVAPSQEVTAKQDKSKKRVRA